ncbi:hypothetical protein GQ457_04G014920 [Hibiscus cannabinus]
MLLGDRNTLYFHRRAVNRKQRNKISTLKLSDGTWCDDNLTLQEEATRYFASLFSKDDTPEEPFPSERSFPTLHDHLLCHLDDLPTDDESKRPDFEVSSAYSHILASPWDDKDQIWDLIWKNTVPQRVRLFLWLTCRQRLMTNSERCRRGLGTSVVCPRCHMADESVLHTLRDCVESKAAWMQLLAPRMREVFFQLDLHSWLRCNLSSHVALPGDDIPWRILFASLLWQLRKNKNDLIFNNLPPFGWICLNVDGAVSPSTCMGSVGGLFRDTDGRWLLGFNKLLGVTSPLIAKLWAIYIGLKLAWDNGFEYVQVQSDCLEVVKLIRDPTEACNSLSLVRAIDLYRRKCLVTEIIWTPRDANKPIDRLAKCVNSHLFDVLTLDEPPDYLQPILAVDISALHS